MHTFKTRIYQADRTFFEGELESIVVPTTDGMYGVLADHRNVVVAIVPGEMHFSEPGKEAVYVHVSEGMLRVEKGEVLILVTLAEYPDEVEENRRKEREEDLREQEMQKRSLQEYYEAEMTLQRAVTGLRHQSVQQEMTEDPNNRIE